MGIAARRVFLMDGLGALLSAAFLGGVLPSFQIQVGMPLGVLYWLALLAVLLALYSLTCLALADCANPRWLRLLSRFNLAYCLLTLSLMGVYSGQLTPLGFGYFLAELVVVGLLVWREQAVLSTLKPK